MRRLNFSVIPEISIILPTFNRAEYLSDCINSVLNQTFRDWELIIVDDGSQDNSFEIIDPLIHKFENIRYIKHRNRKAAYARNAGIQASFGTYITFIDSDDKYKPDHLQSRLDYMKSHPEIDLIEGGVEIEGEMWVPDYYQPNQLINVSEGVLGATFFGRRDIFFELNGFSKMDIFEDTDLWLRAEKMCKTEKIKEPKTYIYIRSKSSTTKDFIKDNISPGDLRVGVKSGCLKLKI